MTGFIANNISQPKIKDVKANIKKILKFDIGGNLLRFPLGSF